MLGIPARSKKPTMAAGIRLTLKGPLLVDLSNYLLGLDNFERVSVDEVDRRAVRQPQVPGVCRLFCCAVEKPILVIPPARNHGVMVALIVRSGKTAFVAKFLHGAALIIASCRSRYRLCDPS